MTDKPDLSIVPDSTADPMAALGATTIAGVLGTYQANVDESAALLSQLLNMQDDGSHDYAERYRAIFSGWRAAERRLGLYHLLANEVSR